MSCLLTPGQTGLAANSEREKLPVPLGLAEDLVGGLSPDEGSGSARRSNVEVEFEARGSEHVDEGVDAEQVNLAAREVRDAGLGDAKLTGGFALSHAAVGDVGDEFLHERRANLHILGCTGSVLDGVPDARVSLVVHGVSPTSMSDFICRYRCLPRSMSALAFSASRTDRRQRLPIEWVIALLDDVKLIADTLTRTLREVAQVVDRTSDERDVLHFANDTKIYILGKPPIACIRYQADRRHPSVRTSGRTPTPPHLLSPAAVSEGSGPGFIPHRTDTRTAPTNTPHDSMTCSPNISSSSVTVRGCSTST